MGTIQTPEDVQAMRVAGRIAAEVLDHVTPFIRPGITTEELDRICHEYILSRGCIPAPLNYVAKGAPHPFPKATCISPNDVICHGIPNSKILRPGDILNIDITVIKDGYHGDTSRMFTVGKISSYAKRLIDVTYECMWRGIEQVKDGAHLGDIGFAIQSLAQAAGYSVVREFCGHGLGKNFHEEPQILHYGQKGKGFKIVPGMCFTIEPMINAGKRDIRIKKDGWTACTKDRSLSAQWEHSLISTPDGCEILTMSPGAPRPPDFILQNPKIIVPIY